MKVLYERKTNARGKVMIELNGKLIRKLMTLVLFVTVAAILTAGTLTVYASQEKLEDLSEEVISEAATAEGTEIADETETVHDAEINAEKDDSDMPTHFEGKCGDNLTYKIDVTYGTERSPYNNYIEEAYMDLVITGSGSTYDYFIPWYVGSGNKEKTSPVLRDGNEVWKHVNKVYTRVTLNGVTRIGNYFFYGMNFYDNDFMNGVEIIGNSAFGSCSFANCVDFVIPNSVKSIGDGSFYCLRLKERENDNAPRIIHKVVIPSSITRIPSSAFEYAVIEKVSFPDTLEYIGSYAFEWSKLEGEIELPDSLTGLGDAVFSDTNVSGTFKVPPKMTCISNAFSTTNITAVQFHNNVTEIAMFAFSITKLKSVVIPDSVTKIGEHAFTYCDDLESVVLPSGLKRIESQTFYDDSKLSYISIPDSVEYIGSKSFYDTPLQGRIELPKNLKNISAQAFSKPFYSSKPGVTEIVFPEGLEEISDCCISSESSLKKAIFLGDEPKTIERDIDDGIGPFPADTVIYYDSNKNWTIVDGKWQGYTAIGDISVVSNKTVFDVTVNGSGIFYAKYKVVDNEGNVRKNTKVTWQVGSSAPQVDTTDEDGYVLIYDLADPEDWITTVSGSPKKRTYSAYVYLGEDPDDDVSKLMRLGDEVKINVTVKPVSFSQTWKGTVDMNLKAGIGAALDVDNVKVNLAKIEGGIGNSPTLELTHKYDGGVRSLSFKETVEPAFSFGSDIGPSIKVENNGQKYGGAPASIDGSVKSKLSLTYGMNINNYDPNNPDHVLKVGKMLMGAVGMTNGSLLLLRAVDALGGNIFDSVGYGSSFSVNTGINLGKVDFGEHSVGLVDIDDDASYSEVITNEKDGSDTIAHKKVVKGSAKLGNYNQKAYASNYDAGVNIKGALLNKELTYNEYSMKKKNGSRGNKADFTLTKCIGYDDESPLGGKSVSRKDLSITYSDDEYRKFLKDHPETLSLIYGDKTTFVYALDSALKDITEGAADTKAAGTYEMIQRNENSITFPIVPSVSGSADIFSLSGGITFLGCDSTEYVLTNGEIRNGVQFPGAQNSVDNYVENSKLTIGDVLSEAAQSVMNMALNTFERIKGKVKSGVDAGMAFVHSKAEEIKDYYVFITTTPESTGGSSGGGFSGGGAHGSANFSSNLRIITYEQINGHGGSGLMAETSISGNEIFTGEATVVGEPYYVCLTRDAEGNDIVDDFSATPLSLTLRYNKTVLEEAGLGLGAVKDMAIYEYSQELRGYNKIGGTLDETNMCITADITHPGEYLLAVPYGSKDYSAPEDDSQPDDVIKTGNDDADGLSEMKIGNSGYVVKYTDTVSFNGVFHIQKGAKETKSKRADVEIHLYDPNGNELNSKAYKITFKNNKNVNGKKKPYFTLTLKGKVPKDVKKAFKKTKVYFTINPLDIGTVKVEYKKIKETSKGMKLIKPYFINETGKKISLSPVNKKKTKGDFDILLSEDKLTLTGYGNYKGLLELVRK